jgi:hypothetical protein
LAIHDNLVKPNNDVLDSSSIIDHKGAPVVKRSLHSSVEQQSLLDSSRSPSRKHRRLRKKLHSSKLKPSPNIFQSTGTSNKNLRAGKLIQGVIDNRLKRFRMLDPDEFQEMLNSLSYQMPEEQSRTFNSMDSIGGMQLESKFSHFLKLNIDTNYFFCLDYWSRK